MAMSGVRLSNECQKVYQEIQMDKKHRYVIFKIQDGEIIVEKIGDRDNKYEQFLEDLQQKDGDNDDCRFAVHDYDYVQQAQGTEASYRSKLFLMSWCPDSAKIKKKMLYSSSFDTLKRSFVGVHKVLQANGDDEVEQAYVESKLRENDRQ